MQAAYQRPTDRDLIDAFQSGDEAAFSVLYERWRGRLRGYALKMLRSEQDADDVVTDAFIKVVDGHYATTGSFKSYLFTVAHRLCLDRLRHRTVKGRVLPLFKEEARAPELEAAIDQMRDAARVEKALAALPGEHRSVLLLYYSQGLSSREVSEVLGITNQQVRSKLSYARKSIRKHLEVS